MSLKDKGDGPAAPGYPNPPANFKDPKWAYLTEEKQIHIVSKGGPAEGLHKCMPGFEDALTEKQIKDVVAYVRTLMTK